MASLRWRSAEAYAGSEPGGDLVAAARRGDRRAFDALVGAYEPQLRGFLARRAGATATDDLLQETWLAAWIALPKLERNGRFKAWLYGIAQHKCADYLRARSRAGIELPPGEWERPGLRSVDDLYAAAETREVVQSLLAGLPAAQREVLEMYYYAELTLPEIARALGRNLNTVKYQFYRAHDQVAQGLDGACPASWSDTFSGDEGPRRP